MRVKVWLVRIVVRAYCMQTVNYIVGKRDKKTKGEELISIKRDIHVCAIVSYVGHGPSCLEVKMFPTSTSKKLTCFKGIP